MKKYRNSSFIFMLFVLVACGGGGTTDPNTPVPGSLAGTLTAPIGGSVQGSLLLACFLQANVCNINSENTEVLEVTGTGGNAAFRLSSLAEGSYILLAFKDTNNDGDLRDIADYQGCYGAGDPCTPVPVRPPNTDLNIQLQTELPTVVPGSISGTLSMPGQVEGTGVLDERLHPLRPTPTTNFRAGEVIVKFKSNGVSTLATYEPLARYQFAGRSLQRVRLLGLRETALYTSSLNPQDTLALVADLNARSDVEYAQPNYLKYALKLPNDPFYGVQWHYRAMNLEKAWDVEDGTTNPVTVAVVDTGLLAHPDLQNVGGYDFVSDTTNAGDGNGRDTNPADLGGDTGYHGGHVAGTVAARTNNSSGLAGVSWGARVVPVRVLGTQGGSIADIIDGTLWAAGESVAGVPANPNPAKVVNLSLGGEGPCSSLEVEAFQTLKNKGVVVVVAAGNDNDDAGFFSPANCDDVITVGATGPTGARAPYSNYGSKIDVMATGGDTSQTIDFNGPRPAGVWSTIKDDESGDFIYASYQGTSMAAPHIAGIASLMLSKEPNLTPDQVLARLVDSAKAMSASQCQRPSGNDCGAGLVDAAAALGSTSTEPPPEGPPTGNVKTYAVAFYCANTFCNDFVSELSRILELSDNRKQIPYQITGLIDGAYAVGAFQDLDGNADLSDGEPFGAYEDLVFIENQEGQGSIDILLEPYTASSTVLARRMMTDLNKISLDSRIQTFSRPAYVELSALEAFLK